MFKKTITQLLYLTTFNLVMLFRRSNKDLKYMRDLLFLGFLVLLMTGCSKDTESTDPPVNTNANSNLIRLNQAINQDADNPDLYYARADLYYQEEGYDEAIRDLEKALTYDSTNAEYLHLLADTYLDYYKSKKALETMERVVEFHPKRIPSLLKLSEFQLILQQYEESMRTLDRVLQIDPQESEAYFMFGMNFKDLGDTARAISSFQSAVDNNPDLIDAWIELGQLHAALGNEIAGQYFDSAIRIEPENVMVKHAKAYYLQEKGDLEGSLALFREIVRQDPQYEDAYYNSGLLYLDLDSVLQAHEQFDMALQVNPVHIRAYYYRGVASEMMGNLPAARDDYEQALRLAPDYARAKEGMDRLQDIQ